MISSVLGVGFLIGMHHALEADHVAAVSSIASQKKGLRNISRHGAFWGLGHALMLAAIAGSAIVLKITLDEQLGRGLEFLVGIMLVGLGCHVLWRLRRDRVHFHAHTHQSGQPHVHAHSHRDEPEHHDDSAHLHEHPESLPWRSLVVGLMHGMAGSAALILLTAATMQSPLWGFIYIVVFGIGSIVGMAALSAAIAMPLTYASNSVTWLHRSLQLVIGCGTVIIGVNIINETSTLFY